MQTLSLRGRSVAFEVFDRGGDGIPVLFVHGSGGARGVWKSQARLGDERPVVALDLPGHGDSDDVDAAAGYETLSAYADDVIAVADATDAGILCGHSMGGAVVMHALLDRRDELPQIEGLALAGTGAKLAVLSDLRDWLDSDFEHALEWLHAPGRLFYDPDDELLALSKTTMRECGRAVVERDFLTSHHFDVRDQLEGIDVPARAIVGEKDPLTPPRYANYLAEELPSCDVAVVEDAAHLPMLEQPRAFNATVAEFCERFD